MPVKHCIVPLVLLVLASGSTWAITATPGQPVSNVDIAAGINDWSPLDDQRLVIKVGDENAYLLTLQHNCTGLTWAENIAVTTSNNVIWAGFDAVHADGLACPIHSIEKIEQRLLPKTH